VYICYDDPQSLWALCVCVRLFFLSSSLHALFPSFHLFRFFRHLGLCSHTAVAMAVTWGREYPEEFKAKVNKNKDGKHRPTTGELFDHLEASPFDKKRSHQRQQGHAYLKKRKLQE